LKTEAGMGLILITHDLGVVADVADEIAVMYAGRIVERAPVHPLYRAPRHPYTRGLIDSIPRVDQHGEELYAIKGLPPSLLDLPSGCSFRPRCPLATDRCATERPLLRTIEDDRVVACHHAEEVSGG
jgi:oligopeptide/dipeptide ABC transporter ATP-binding protein